MAARKKKAKRAAKPKKAKKAAAPKSKSKKAIKKPAKKKVKAAAKKAPARKAAKKASKKTIGEGDYAASRAFLKDQSGFVAKNKAKISGLGKEAEKALDGPEGASLEGSRSHRSGPFPRHLLIGFCIQKRRGLKGSRRFTFFGASYLGSGLKSKAQPFVQ